MSDIIYNYNDSVYLNITNKCPCKCEFCIRNNTDAIGDADELWLHGDPDLEEIIAAIDSYDFDGKRQVVFCGYGEPTNAFDNLIAVSKHLKEKYGMHIRVNTNGLSDLINERPTAEDLCRNVDAVSISLNTCNAEKYNAIVHPRFGIKSFDAMLKFAKECKQYLDDVKLTVVDVIPGEEIEECRRIADSIGVPLRVRHYSE